MYSDFSEYIGHPSAACGCTTSHVDKRKATKCWQMCEECIMLSSHEKLIIYILFFLRKHNGADGFDWMCV